MKKIEKNPWETLTIENVYENPWIKITHRDVLNPSGGKGIYGVVHFKNIAIGILPLDKDNNTWLVGQYRYTMNQYSWEIPEGGGPFGEPPLVGAKRELQEETGILAKKWTKILDAHTSNSITDEVAVGYVAQNLTFGEAAPEETEDLKIRKVPFKEVIEMIMRGEIQDALTICIVLKAKMMMDRGLL